MVISTEPSLLISDLNQSPFDLGLKIVLDDFDEDQVQRLHTRYQSPLGPDEINELMDLLSGHPYLTSKALYLVATEEMTWERLKKIAHTDRSPFSDHLRRHWWMLRDDQSLVDALKIVLDHGVCSDYRSFYRLSRAGLIKGDDERACTFRCKLYQEYFRKRL